ncbi:MAG: precorrin-8X methylmutase [Blautia sp.]|nr:precorrin-8X methylmutase [Blautia sp.]
MCRGGVQQMEFCKPAEIEKESMRIISEEISARGITLPEDIAPVVKRVIHTTADFDYLDTLFFSPGAVRKGIEALKKGKVIVTDTNMALAGISKKSLVLLGGKAVCFMADEAVAAEAREQGITRAVVSVRHAAELYPECIYAVGNAPTALFELGEQIRKGMRPSLIVALPVGFVNVVEAKEMIIKICTEENIPIIASRGRKGGSNVAAAICNALIYKAIDI